MFSRNAPIFSIKRRIARTARCCRSKEEAVCPSVASGTTHRKHSKAQQKKVSEQRFFRSSRVCPCRRTSILKSTAKCIKTTAAPISAQRLRLKKLYFLNASRLFKLRFYACGPTGMPRRIRRNETHSPASVFAMFFLYCFGARPICCLNTFIKWLGDENPISIEISVILLLVVSKSLCASFIRR